MLGDGGGFRGQVINLIYAAGKSAGRAEVCSDRPRPASRDEGRSELDDGSAVAIPLMI